MLTASDTDGGYLGNSKFLWELCVPLVIGPTAASDNSG